MQLQRRDFDNLIGLWATGELPESEMRQFDDMLEANPDLKDEAYNYMKVLDLLRSIPSKEIIPADLVVRAEFHHILGRGTD